MPKPEHEFLPAVLEVQETPPSPLGRAVAWTLLALVTITIVWACVGEVDIVASAQGKIIPGGRDKLIQPLEAGVVRAIHVQEGQRVAAGEVLIELDATVSNADEERLGQEWRQARLDAARSQALAAYELRGDSLRVPSGAFAGIDDVSPDQLSQHRALLQSQLNEYSARLAAFSSEVAQRQAERAGTGRLVEKLQATLPMASERATALKTLAEKNLASRQNYLELEQARLEQQHDLAAQQEHVKEIDAAIATVRRQRDALLAEIKARALAERADAERRVTAAEQELRKAEQRQRLQRLTAPVAGSVHQLEVHTLGGVVTPAQALMIIVPDDQALEVEAWLANKDIGFVEAGQIAEVKIDAFPFTKYGTLDAAVVHVSSDAVADENLGLVYKAKVHLEKATIDVGGKHIPLSPGMSVTAEIKTGKRKLIEYVLSPVMEYAGESGRER